MRKNFYKAVIHDIVSMGLSENEQESLIDLFESLMKSTSSLVRQACFNTTDFATAKSRGVEGFDLTLIRVDTNGQEFWEGKFTKGQQLLELLGSLEP